MSMFKMESYDNNLKTQQNKKEALKIFFFKAHSEHKHEQI